MRACRRREHDPIGVVPEVLRPAIRAELQAIVTGDGPGVMLRVREYPATLIPKPEAMWSHPLSEVQVPNDGTAWCVLPLWTMDESASDLSAELEIDEQGRVTISDVHVL